MTEPDFVIPEDQLPEGFAERIDDPPDVPVTPRAAATVVLMRNHEQGVQILLLQRARSSGFVPGAYVFPGGLVDADDAAPAILERAVDLTLEATADRLDLHDADPPAAAYYLAAMREAFEETGILVGHDRRGGPVSTAAQNESVLEARNRLLDEACTFAEALDDLGALLDGRAMEYIAHWITPLAEPRRYDARFFAAAVPDDAEPAIHAAEMTDAIWINPRQALERTEEGSLPMVFPTIKTVEALASFDSTEAILDGFRERTIPSILPRLIRTPEGIALRIPEVVSDYR